MSSSSASSSLGASIPQALVNGDATLVRVKASVGVAVVVFVCLVLIPARSLAAAARRSAVVGLLLVACQTVLVGIFLYFILARGPPWPGVAASSPIPLLPDGKTEWLFSIWRPLTVLLTVGAGVMSSASPVPKYVCLVGCCWDVVQDLVSVVQIGSYLAQVAGLGAPLGANYSAADLQVLYWRDIVALGVSFLLLLETLHLFVLQGVATEAVAPHVTWQQIQGGETDRAGVLGRQRYARLAGECDAELAALRRGGAGGGAGRGQGRGRQAGASGSPNKDD